MLKNKELVLPFKSLIGHLNYCAPYQEIRGKIPLGISSAYYILIQCFSNHCNPLHGPEINLLS